MLKTERALLRRLTKRDAAALHCCTGDPQVMRYWYPGPDVDLAATARRIAEIDAHWRRHGFGDFAVCEPASGELVGFAGLHYIAGMAEVNIGYALQPAYWRCGLGTAVSRLLLEHGFAALDLPQIVAVIDPGNEASVALVRKVGFSFARELTWQGQARVLYAVAAADWEAGR